mmetsp:Transcript_746/g.2591  ORF Transcript_746/g.2591 Transcript_746/m.2591 type:complete len:237 (+) Transcript_746:325-1035(+)
MWRTPPVPLGAPPPSPRCQRGAGPRRWSRSCGSLPRRAARRAPARADDLPRRIRWHRGAPGFRDPENAPSAHAPQCQSAACGLEPRGKPVYSPTGGHRLFDGNGRSTIPCAHYSRVASHASHTAHHDPARQAHCENEMECIPALARASLTTAPQPPQASVHRTLYFGAAACFVLPCCGHHPTGFSALPCHRAATPLAEPCHLGRPMAHPIAAPMRLRHQAVPSSAIYSACSHTGIT